MCENKKCTKTKKNYPDRYCEKCDRKITYSNWTKHLKSQRHLRDKPVDPVVHKYDDKYCEACDRKITYKNWATHLKGGYHIKRNRPLQNDGNNPILKD